MPSIRRVILLVAAIAWGACATCAGADESAPLVPSRAPVRDELAAVVRAQIAAFRDGDFASALRFASAKFRAQIDVTSFEKLVRKNYAPLVVAKSSEPFDATDNGREAAMNVRVVGADDVVVYFRYLFAREDGVWTILGVIAIEPPPVVSA